MATEPEPISQTPIALPTVLARQSPTLASAVPATADRLAACAAVPRYSRPRLAMAVAIAAISDLISVWVEFIPPLQLIVDLVTAFLLFMVLGWRWLMLPALVAESIPGLAVFPIWLLVVLSLAILPSRSPGKPPTEAPHSNDAP